MIIFDLICEHDHRFEGWFHSAKDFDSQSERGLLACPHCASSSIRKLPSAVSISSMRSERVSGGGTEEEKSQAILPVAAPSNTQIMGIGVVSEFGK